MYNKFDSRIIVVGGSGLIGNSLNQYLKKNNCNVTSTYNKNKIPGMINFDFTKDDISKKISNINKKDIFIILSAIGNPSWIAENKEKAYKINVVSTINLINQISEIGCKIYFMSSVEIFDGTSETIVESTKPNPLNYYGETKLLVEEYLNNNCSNYHIIRTGWNVGITEKSRCVVSLTYKTLLNKGAKMATDNSFTVTHVEDLSKAIGKIIFNNKRKIVHLCSSEIIKRTKLADAIIKQSKKGNKMSYKDALFSDIKFNEPRARLNNLRTEYEDLNKILYFRPVEETIKQKVNFLDEIR